MLENNSTSGVPGGSGAASPSGASNEPAPSLQAGFGVSSRHFKKAVDRNRIKRLTRCPGEIRFVPLEYTDVELRIPNVEKARSLLGFEAQVELDEGLARTIAWYRARLGTPA